MKNEEAGHLEMIQKCYFCKGRVLKQEVTVDYRWGETLMVIKGVPAGICQRCGEKYIESNVYKGMERFECREKILDDLENDGLLEKTEPYNHATGHCYRCKTMIEPLLSKQWFVRTSPLAEKAIEAVLSSSRTGELGDGKIFISEVTESIRIRTGERGPESLYIKD